MGMDTRTGEVRPLAEGEEPREHEVVIDQAERDALVELPPHLRLAHLMGMRGGKDRKASRPKPKSDRQRRYERAAARKARAAGRQP